MRPPHLESRSTFVPVVAAAISDGVGRLLLQQCLPQKRYTGRWEFPGGKVEVAETPRFALVREVMEELGIELNPDALEPAGFAEASSTDGPPGLVLFLYRCLAWSGEPEGREGQLWGWFSPAEAMSLDLPPMDRALLSGLPPHGAG